MRNAAMLLGVVAVGVLSLGPGHGAAARPGCSAGQWCERTPGGSSCEVYAQDGQRWCRRGLECDNLLSMTPLEVSPAGRYLAPGSARRTEGGVRTEGCDGFVVRRAPGGRSRPAAAATIRI